MHASPLPDRWHSGPLRPADIHLYLGLLSVFFAGGALLLLSYGYQGSFLLINRQHSVLADWLVPQLSNLGDSLILGALLVLVCWRRDPALAVLGIFAVAITGLLSQFLKRNLFAEWHRPLTVFAELVPRIHSFPHEQLRHNSFPSGHSTTAISGFTVLAWYYRQHHQGWQAAWAVLALAVCHARVYMGVHFLGDVLAGGLLALVGTLLLGQWAYPGIARWMQRRSPQWHARAARILLAVGVVGLIIGIAKRYAYLVA